jgi:hypothetical protein
MRTGTKFFTALAVIFLVTPVLRAADAPKVQWPAKLGNWADSGSGFRPIQFSAMSQELLQEAGLEATNSRIYNQENNKAYVTLYTFRDSSGAYQALPLVSLHLFKNDGTSPDARTIYKSNQILDIVTEGKIGDEAANAAATWAKSMCDGVAAPPIADYLPVQDRILGSSFYALGPAGLRNAEVAIGRHEDQSLIDGAGFNSHAEAMLAKYKNAKDEATLLLIEYPTPQLAELHLRHLQLALADAKLTTSSIERKGSLLSIVLAPSSTEYADKLRASVNYETQVTWNEPSSTATDPPITSTLVKIIIATFVFMGVTLVLGIAFGGVRVITKRLFPGKVFDRKNQIEVLQLGLTGKPIDPTDLY